MLSQETREGIRQGAEGLSSALSDQEREKIGQRAWRVIDNLHEEFDDDAAACAAYMLAAVLAGLNAMPLRYVNETITQTMDTYLLAAGRLAGVYTLPERKTDVEASDDGPPPYIPAPAGEDVESPGTGFYL